MSITKKNNRSRGIALHAAFIRRDANGDAEEDATGDETGDVVGESEDIATEETYS